MSKREIYDAILNPKQGRLFTVGTVYTVDPFAVILDGDTTAIPCQSLTGLLGLKVGSRVVLLRYGKQYIAVGVIGKSFDAATKVEVSTHEAETYADDVHGLAGKVIEESGSDTNGSYVRWSNGLQVCWIPSVTLAYVNTAMLRASWTYPVGFISKPVGSANPIGYSPTVAGRSSSEVINCGTSSCTIAASTQTGAFGVDDTWQFQAIVVGWWK